MEHFSETEIFRILGDSGCAMPKSYEEFLSRFLGEIYKSSHWYDKYQYITALFSYISIIEEVGTSDLQKQNVFVRAYINLPTEQQNDFKKKLEEEFMFLRSRVISPFIIPL